MKVREPSHFSPNFTNMSTTVSQPEEDSLSLQGRAILSSSKFASYGLALILFLTLSLNATSGFAQLSESRWGDGFTLEKDAKAPTGWWSFASAGMGLLNTDVDSTGNDGHLLNVRGIMSYYAPQTPWVYDIGLGVINSNPNDSNVTSLLVEGAARYRWTPRFHLGPVVETVVGGSDSYGSRWRGFTPFIGASSLYDIALQNNNLLRLGLRASVDATIPNSTASFAMIEAHYSFSGGRPTQSSTPAPVRSRPLTQDRTPTLGVSSIAPFELENARVDISPEDRRRILSWAESILLNLDEIQTIQVTGYADSRGSSESNQRLSLMRAQNVATILIQAGVPQEKLKVIGHGDRFASEEPVARDRRVDIKILN